VHTSLVVDEVYVTAVVVPLLPVVAVVGEIEPQLAGDTLKVTVSPLTPVPLVVTVAVTLEVDVPLAVSVVGVACTLTVVGEAGVK
jgi:hypothetical protein